jgi:hypothetical protein
MEPNIKRSAKYWFGRRPLDQTAAAKTHSLRNMQHTQYLNRRS